MGADIHAITQAALPETGHAAWAEQMQKKVEALGLPRAKRKDPQTGELYEEQGAWSYYFDEVSEYYHHYSICFEGPTMYALDCYENLSIISTAYRFCILFMPVLNFSFKDTLRSEIFQLMQLLGGQEVILLPDQSYDPLGYIFQSMAIENYPYEAIKAELYRQVGPPLQDWSVLPFDPYAEYDVPEGFSEPTDFDPFPFWILQTFDDWK